MGKKLTTSEAQTLLGYPPKEYGGILIALYKAFKGKDEEIPCDGMVGAAYQWDSDDLREWAENHGWIGKKLVMMRVRSAAASGSVPDETAAKVPSGLPEVRLTSIHRKNLSRLCAEWNCDDEEALLRLLEMDADELFLICTALREGSYYLVSAPPAATKLINRIAKWNRISPQAVVDRYMRNWQYPELRFHFGQVSRRKG